MASSKKIVMDESKIQQVAVAVVSYLGRQARKEHPAGDFDNAKRWYPSDSEECECCEGLRSPSRSWPNSLNKHCRSLEHVAALNKVARIDLSRAVKLVELNEISHDSSAISALLISEYAVSKIKPSKAQRQVNAI